jgi:hypothetical protein
MEHKPVKALDGPARLGPFAQYHRISDSNLSRLNDSGIETTNIQLVQHLEDFGYAYASPDGFASLGRLRHTDDGLTNLEIVTNVNILVLDMCRREVLAKRRSRKWKRKFEARLGEAVVLVGKEMDGLVRRVMIRRCARVTAEAAAVEKTVRD